MAEAVTIAERSTGIREIPAWAVVAFFAAGHMLVDGASIGAAYRAAGRGKSVDATEMILLYNTMAFLPQALLGWLVDWVKRPYAAAGLGAALTVAALVLGPTVPWAAAALAGAGNALYHVGAGGVCLKLARGTAAMGGVYVGPGDLGVVVGVFVGMGVWPGLRALLVANVVVVAGAAVMVWKREVGIHRGLVGDGGFHRGVVGAGDFHRGPGAAIVGLLLVAVAARQMVGGAVGGPWFSEPTVWVALGCAAMVGKMGFGFVADRWGWMVTVVPLAVVAALLVPLAGGRWGVALAATLLVQAAMPVTLGALGRVVPRRPALAFGMASSALWVGALPGWLWKVPAGAVWGAQGLAVAALAGALWLLARKERDGAEGGGGNYQ